MTVETVAAVIMLREVGPLPPTEEGGPPTGRVDFAGRDCESVEDALGHLRDAFAKLRHDGWKMAMIVPGHTVAEVAGNGPL